MWTFAARALTRLASAVGLLTLVIGIPVLLSVPLLRGLEPHPR